MSTKYCRLCCDDLFESSSTNCRVFEFSCGHRLHTDCVLSWTISLGPRSSCPICEGVTTMTGGTCMPKSRINSINKPVAFKKSLAASKPLIIRPAAYLPYSSPMPRTLQLPQVFIPKMSFNSRTSSMSSLYTATSSSGISTPSSSDSVLFEAIQQLQLQRRRNTWLQRA
uniref:RING-type domain-containing protein n=1 Tax=Panagrellus redivivus TaxID=6233 RepID=A0A7E4VDA1_PANRE